MAPMRIRTGGSWIRPTGCWKGQSEDGAFRLPKILITTIPRPIIPSVRVTIPITEDSLEEQGKRCKDFPLLQAG